MAIGLQVWSQTAANNATSDTNVNWAEGQAPSSVNDSARAEMASAAKWRDDNNGTLVTSGSSTAYTVTTNQVEAALTAGYTVAVQFHATNDSAATINVDSLGAKPLQTVAGVNLTGGEYSIGNIARFTYSSSGTGQWIAHNTVRPTVLANSLSTDVSLSSTASFFDGPAVAQGTAGTWLAMGTITLSNPFTSTQFSCKLWDGTTVIDSGYSGTTGSSGHTTVSLSGVITSPAGNIKISARDDFSGSGKIQANPSGNSKDSTITAIRIG